MSPSLREIYLQPSVAHDLKKLQKKAKVRYDKIREKLNTLANDSEDESIPLQDQYFQGLRRIRAGEDRIIFQRCEECWDNPIVQKLRRCNDCDTIPENAIKVFDIHNRRNAYDTNRFLDR